MSNYLDVIPLDLRHLVLFNLPFEKAQTYCTHASCDNRFWREYNSLNYFVDPKNYLPGLDAYQMSKWINELLNAYFEKKIAVNVYSLNDFLKYFNDPSSQTRSDMYRSHPHLMPIINPSVTAMAYLKDQMDPESKIMSVPRRDLKKIVIPFDYLDISYIFNTISPLVDKQDQSISREQLNNKIYQIFVSHPLSKDFFAYLTSMVKRKTPYFIPGGIKFVNYDSNFVNNFIASTSRDGQNLIWILWHIQHALSIFVALDKIKDDVYAEEISQFFD